MESLEGVFAVEDSARLIRNYRYAVERMTRVLGGWLALTPELSAKLLMGRHVWDGAQHADAFGKRLPELRAHAQVSEPSSPAFAAFLDAVESPEAPAQTVERLVGIYRVLKPHLVATYERHLGRANGVYEPPTRRILARCIEDERRHVAAGLAVLHHLAGAPERAARAQAWGARLAGLLAAAGGVTGDELSAPGGVPVEAAVAGDGPEALEFIRLEAATHAWPIPADLMAAIDALGSAAIARDAAAVERWLGPAGGGAEAAREVLAVQPRAHRVVACARIGVRRVVKLRLDGVAASVALVTRWMPAPPGWRVEATEVARVGADRPA